MNSLKSSVRQSAWMAGLFLSAWVNGLGHAEGVVATVTAVTAAPAVVTTAAPVAAPVAAPSALATAPTSVVPVANAASAASSGDAGPRGDAVPNVELAPKVETLQKTDAAKKSEPAAKSDAKPTESAAEPGKDPAVEAEFGKDPASVPGDEFQRYVMRSIGTNLPLFGGHLFNGGPSTFAPLDNVPVTSDYVLGPGDELLIRVWGAIDVEMRAVIDRNGQINIPKVGTFGMAGIHASEVEAYLRGKIGRMFRNFELNVTMGQLRSISVYVVGHAKRPGTYTLSSLSTLINALFASGGPSADGTMRRIQLKRAGQVVTEMDLYDFIVKGDNSRDVRLLPGDVIVIPPVGARVAIAGSFSAPAIYELKDRQASIREVLGLSGGLSVVTTDQLAALERIDKSQATPRRVEHLGLDETGLDKMLQDGDILTLFPISPKFDNAITLKGNVASPMRYAWRKGMRVTDLLVDTNALLPASYWDAQNRGQVNSRYTKNEVNWDYATVQRLDAKKLKTVLFAFDLGKAVRGDATANVVLEPGDIVTVYGWNDSLPETENSILFGGDVLGGSKRFVWHPEMRIRDVIPNVQWLIDYYDYWNQLKGDAPKRKIDWDFATYRRLDPVRLTKKDYSFSLGRALQGDARDNILLKPGDEVRLYFWDETPADTDDSLVLSGDVIGGSKRFAWREGMRIRDIIPDTQWLIEYYDYWSHIKGGDPKRKIDFDFATYQRLDPVNLKKKDYSFSLGRALQGDERDNILLKPGDVLKLYTWGETPIETEDSIAISGDAIGGSKRFAWREGLRIRDIIPNAQWLIDYYDYWNKIKGGGPKRKIDFDFSIYQRLDPVELKKKDYSFSLRRAFKGDEQDNILLNPGDALRLYTWDETPAETDDSLLMIGEAVGIRKRFSWREGMRVRDLIPDAQWLIEYYDYWNQIKGGDAKRKLDWDFATYRRLDPIRLVKKDYSIALNRALKGEERDNVVLRPGDELHLYSWGETPIETEDSLTLSGEPVGGKKRFAWREGMRISDLIPDAKWLVDYYNYWQNIGGEGKKTEINWDYANLVRLSPSDLSKSTFSFNLGHAIANPGSTDNLRLQPGDAISLYTNEQFAMPIAKRKVYVSLGGEVATPGLYQANPGETLRQLVMRVGGLSPQAYTYGAEFFRESTRATQQKKLDEVLNRMDRNLVLSTSEAASSVSTAGAVASKEASSAYQRQVIEKLRAVKASGRIVLEVPPDSKGITFIPDLPLEDGDRLIVPARPSVVHVVGEVNNENSYIFKDNKNLRDYLDQAGGITDFANEDGVYVIKADGSVVAESGRGWFSGWFGGQKIYPGDTIVVPMNTEGKFSFVNALKDWTQILYQMGMGVAGLKVLKDL